MTDEQHDDVEGRRQELHEAEQAALADYDTATANGTLSVQHVSLLSELHEKVEQATAERQAFEREHPV